MSKNAPAFVPTDVPKDARIAIVAARFNSAIVDALQVTLQSSGRAVVHRRAGGRRRADRRGLGLR